MPEGKRPPVRSCRRCVDDVKMDLVGTGFGVVDWIVLAQERYRWRALVNSVMNSRVHKMMGNYRVATNLVCLSSSAQLRRVS
jgi:hypothetical protein